MCSNKRHGWNERDTQMRGMGGHEEWGTKGVEESRNEKIEEKVPVPKLARLILKSIVTQQEILT